MEPPLAPFDDILTQPFPKPGIKMAKEWLEDYRRRLDVVIQHFPEAYRDLASPLTQGIFPGLHLLCFSALLNGQNSFSKSDFDDLQQHLAKGDILDQLPEHHTVKQKLVRLLGHPKLSNLQDMARRIISIDGYHILSQMIHILSDPTLRNKLLYPVIPDTTRDQTIIDVLQALLDLDGVGTCKGPIRGALLELSRSSKLFPLCLRQPDVNIVPGSASLTDSRLGTVWLGDLRGQAMAVKVIRTVDIPDKILKDWSCELTKWSQLRHPNILPFSGICQWDQRGRPSYQKEQMALLSPWMVNGNVIQYLAGYPNTNRTPLLFDVARGINYLHTFDPSIVHGCLKGSNVLITDSGRARLADFGLDAISKDVVRLASSTHSINDAELFTAPELLFDDSFGSRSFATDMYAFACLCYEIYNGTPRYGDIKSLSKRLAAVQAKKPCRKPDLLTDDELWSWIQRCWDMKPSARPTITNFLEEFKVDINWPGAGSVQLDDGIIRSNFLHLELSVPDNNSISSLSSAVARSIGPSLHLQVDSLLLKTGTRGKSSISDGESTQLQQGDLVIVLVGMIGSGKNTFVSHVIGQETASVGGSGKTVDFCIYECEHPNDPQLRSRVFLVDTPDMDGTDASAQQTLERAGSWLFQKYSSAVPINGVIYSVNLANTGPQISLDTTPKLWRRRYGRQGFDKTIFLTSGWEYEPISIILERERHLRDQIPKIIDKGARYHRFRSPDPTTAAQNAWDVVDMLQGQRTWILGSGEDRSRAGNGISTWFNAEALKRLLNYFRKKVS